MFSIRALSGLGRRWLVASTAVAVTVVGLSLTTINDSAQAAPANRFGFVLWNGATVGSGTWPAATTVAVIGVGRYQVTFPGQAFTGGTAHVTAVNSGPIWCQLNGFGPSGADEIVQLSCYKVGGSPTATAFSAIFDGSSAPIGPATAEFGYVNSQASGAIISQYNSVGPANSVLHTGTGTWQVTFPGLATPGPVDGSLQATAVSPQIPARCKVTSWSSSSSGQVANLACFNAAGAGFDTQFTVSYQYRSSLYNVLAPPKYFGYLWNVPLGGPASTNYNNPLGGPANTVSISGTGLWLVTFPQLAVLPDNIEVTAAGGSSEFCNLQSIWTHSATDTLVRNVACYNNAGAPANVGSLVSDNSLN